MRQKEQMDELKTYETLRLEMRGDVGWLWLSRPDKANAMSFTFWRELSEQLSRLRSRDQLRVLVIAGEGKHFSAGAELDLLSALVQQGRAAGCAATARERLRDTIVQLQEGFSAIEQLPVPVIAAVHGACIGAGLDLIAACDLRYSTADAKFCLKEVDFAVVADVGSLQRLRHIIGLPALTELAFTAETFDGVKARSLGLVGGTFGSRDELFAAVHDIAQRIAAKPSLTVRGVKRNLLYSRDHTVAEGLDYVATWNASALPSDDCAEAIEAQRRRVANAAKS
jgi:enoyl-CoA hydratase